MKPGVSLCGLIVALFAAGCSGGIPSVPHLDAAAVQPLAAVCQSNRVLWGVWEISIDPAAGSVNAVPARFGEFHANVRKFLEEGPCTNCLRVVPPIVPKPYGMDVKIALRHPFQGNTFYNGFDVRGIVMLEGDWLFPGAGFLTTRAKTGGWALLNPDGYTPVFNAVDYTLPGIFGYSKGKMIPSSWGKPANTLNAFKAFWSYGQGEENGGRRGFRAGDEIERTYELQLVSGLPFRFWYAVDASWEPPSGVAPYEFSDFPVTANCPEAYRFDFSVISGELYPSGGTVTVGVDIWDHQGWHPPYQINIEAPECFDTPISYGGPPLYVSGEKAHWEFSITNQIGHLDPLYGAELLIVAVNNDPDPYLGDIDGVGRWTIPVGEGPQSPVVYSIDPPYGEQGGGVDNAHITGDNFVNGCTVRLVKPGEADIAGIDIVFQDAQNVFADFILSGATGLWDVVVENPGGATGTLPQGFEILPPSGCNSTIHHNFLGTGDFNGGTNMPAGDACFVHDTGTKSDGELMGYISGFAGTVCTTYIVDTLVPELGHGLGGDGWGNPHPKSWPTPNSIDIAEESGRFFISWSDAKSMVEVWEFDGKLAGETDASHGGTVFCLDTDGHYGFWVGYFPQYGFAPGIMHFVPDGPLPGQLVEKEEDHIMLPEVWGTPHEIVCIPDYRLVVLTGSNNGTVRVYDISSGPPKYVSNMPELFSGPLSFGKWPQKPCDMDVDWSDPEYAHCRIIIWGNLESGGGELIRIDTTPSVLAGPITIKSGWYDSMVFNPDTRNITLWPERDGSPGGYAIVELPPGW